MLATYRRTVFENGDCFQERRRSQNDKSVIRKKHKENRVISLIEEVFWI